MNRGILITAFGHPYYAKMAVNLAGSIKLGTDQFPIKLCIDSASAGGIDLNQRGFFSEIEVVDKQFYLYAKTNHWGLMKTKLNQLTPYEQTLYLDTDSLLLPDKKIVSLFDTINTEPFATEVRGSLSLLGPGNIGGWASTDSVNKLFTYVNPVVPAFTQTSWIAFDKSELSARIFSESERVCLALLENGGFKKWYKSVPDELCFALAFAITGFNPKRDISLCHFDTNPARVDRRNILDNFTLVTFPSAGSDIHQGYRDFYNMLVMLNAGKLKMGVPATVWKRKETLNRNNPLQQRDRR